MTYRPYYKDKKGNLVDLPLYADRADKLGISTIGSKKEPIYLNQGIPEKCSELDSKIIDLIYPIGSIYISVNNTNPKQLFGGEWEQLKDKFLLGAGTTYTNGQSGGEATHTLTTNELPSHNHSASCSENGTHTHSVYSTDTWSTNAVGLQHGTKAAGVAGVDQWGGNESYNTNQAHGEQILGNSGNHTHTITIGNSGNGAAHNNMPPYLVVNIWKRTA